VYDPGDTRTPGSRPGAEVAQDAAAHSGVSDDTLRHVAAPRLELRFDEDERLPAGRREPDRRRQHAGRGDERDVARDQLGRERQRVQVPRIDALEHGDAVVVAQPWLELPAPAVERDPPCRAALQEAVRDPAGRGAEVDAVLPAR